MTDLIPIQSLPKLAVNEPAIPSAGLTQRAVVSLVEAPNDWEAHRAGVVVSLDASGYLETVLADRIALLLWRLARVARAETEAISTRQEQVEDDLAERRKRDPRRPAHTACHPADVSGEADYHAEQVRLVQRFSRMKDHQRLSGDAASSLLWTIARTADVDLEEYALPGIDHEAVLEELPGWTVGKVRACIQAIAEANPDDPEELLRTAQEYHESRARLARIEVGRVAEQVRQLQRERLLPSADTLDKQSRYETHLSRELATAIQELRMLQDRRRSTPPGLQIDSNYYITCHL